MKYTTLEELTEKKYGSLGSLKRDRFERKLKLELFKEKIKQLRKEKNLSQKELGDSIGLEKSQISELENDTQNSTIETLFKVLGALNVDINFTSQIR